MSGQRKPARIPHPKRVEGPVDPDEYEEVKKAAEAQGLSMRVYVRQTVLKAVRADPILSRMEEVTNRVAQNAKTIGDLAQMHKTLGGIHREVIGAVRDLHTAVGELKAMQHQLADIGAALMRQLDAHQREAEVNFGRTNGRIDLLADVIRSGAGARSPAWSRYEEASRPEHDIDSGLPPSGLD